MNDIKGDLHHNDHSSHVRNKDSYNSTTANTTDSHNDSARTDYGDRMAFIVGVYCCLLHPIRAYGQQLRRS
jgi:hypothetical protein